MTLGTNRGEFDAEVVKEILKRRNSNAVGAVGNFVADIEAHRARYAKKLDTIRVGADAATIALANETVRKIDASPAKEAD